MSKDHATTFYPKSAKEWRNWLAINHKKEKSIWVIFYKKSVDKPSLSWSEAVDQALCFGWIDSTKKTIDAESYKQYFSVRKIKSNWSRINKDKVHKLTSEGLMSAKGLAIVEKAKLNGSWNILDSIENLIVPPNLEIAFNHSPKAKKHYLTLSNSKKKMLLGWIVLAKREETKTKRIKTIVENLIEGKLPPNFG